jgi:hypothetical protein
MQKQQEGNLPSQWKLAQRLYVRSSSAKLHFDPNELVKELAQLSNGAPMPTRNPETCDFIRISV